MNNQINEIIIQNFKEFLKSEKKSNIEMNDLVTKFKNFITTEKEVKTNINTNINTNTIVENCAHIFLTGKNKGTNCKSKVIENGYCKIHNKSKKAITITKYDPESDVSDNEFYHNEHFTENDNESEISDNIEYE